MTKFDRIKKYNKIIVWLIVAETLIRQFIPIGGVILAGVIGVILFCFIKKVYGSFPKPYVETYVVLFSLLILCLIQMLDLSPQPKAIVLAWILFLVMFCFSNWNITLVSTIKTSAYLISIIGSISVLSLGGFSALSSSVRDVMLIDKGMLTIWYSITLCISFTDSILSKNKHMSNLMFLFTFLVNLVVVQSKTCVVAFIVYFIMLLLFAERHFRKKILHYTFPVLIIYGVLCISNPTEYIPHTFIVAINQVVGSDVIPVYTDKFDMGSYDSRELIDVFCANLFIEYPIAGIGLGNYEFIPIRPTEVTECENTYFDLLVNGGILYGGPVVLALLLASVKCIKFMRKVKMTVEYYYIFGILTSIIVCFRWNDFLNVNIFMFIGICYYFCKDRNNLAKFC